MYRNHLVYSLGLSLILLPLIWIGVRQAGLQESFFKSFQNTIYKVEYRINSVEEGRPEYVKINVPQLYPTQELFAEEQQSPGCEFSTWRDDTFKKVVWNVQDSLQPLRIKYEFLISGRPVRFVVDESLTQAVNQAHRAARSAVNKLYDIHRAHDFQLHEYAVASLTDQNLDARVVAGYDLQQETALSLIYWMEVKMGNEWIPFDLFRGHHAFLPVSYLKIDFGLTDIVKTDKAENMVVNVEAQQIPSHLAWESGVAMDMVSGLIAKAGEGEAIPLSFLRILLLMPLAVVIVALSRNVIGIKTFGVFLPALLAIAFEQTGLIPGVTIFLVVITVVSILHFPMERWGLLYTPKLVILLILVVMIFLSLTYVGRMFDVEILAQSAFFPIVILTITAERFAKSITEEGMKDTFMLMFQTLLVAAGCFVIFNSEAAGIFFLTFPEALLILIGLSLILGKWVGLRVSEYRRFQTVPNA